MRSSLLIVFLYFYQLSFCQTTNSDCNESFVLSNDENKNNYTYNAQDFIVTDGNYEVTALNNEIKMKAGNVIALKPDTYIKKGALYLARIEPCILSLCENTPIPKGISPDNNLINDNLDLSNNCPIIMLEIFNRYGIKVYEKENYTNEWYGKDINNNLLPNGTYYYYINFENGKQKTGWIYINY